MKSSKTGTTIEKQVPRAREVEVEKLPSPLSSWKFYGVPIITLLFMTFLVVLDYHPAFIFLGSVALLIINIIYAVYKYKQINRYSLDKVLKDEGQMIFAKDVYLKKHIPSLLNKYSIRHAKLKNTKTKTKAIIPASEYVFGKDVEKFDYIKYRAYQVIYLLVAGFVGYQMFGTLLIAISLTPQGAVYTAVFSFFLFIAFLLVLLAILFWKLVNRFALIEIASKVLKCRKRDIQTASFHHKDKMKYIFVVYKK